MAVEGSLICPDCKGETMAYHESYKDGGRTRIVCRKKCKGWKIIKEIERWPECK